MMRSFNTQLEKALPDLWRYACSLTRDRDAADDLVQDCIERALRKRLVWMPGRPLKPWLTKIMLNLYRDRWRSSARFPTTSLDFIDEIAAQDTDAITRLELRDIWRRLETIPPEQSQALLAVVVGGLSYDEAAWSLGIPRGTLMSRIARARSKLKTDPDLSSHSLRSVK